MAWLLIQAASILFPTFEAPAWVMKVVVAVVALGFPIALILAWAFELTPEGIKRAEDVAPSTSITRRTGSKIVYLTIAAAVVAAGLLAFQFLRTKTAAVSAVAAPPQLTPIPSPAFTVAAIPAKSIAVLPFDNLSEDKANAYFAEGVQDEILTRLAKVADLKVISRTSTQKYKSAPDNLRAIAQQLGVANILEGSVQKSNDQMRVNVQLINATNDAHLWAEIYDRKLTDIFAVESEIAKTITDTLQARLTGSERKEMAKAPTANHEAYELYLKGRFFWNKRTGDDLKTARGFFEQAIAADPNYAAAYAGLAQTDLLIPVFGAGPPRDFMPKALGEARRAIALDEASAEAHSALALLLCFQFKFPESEVEFKRANLCNPNYATAHHWYGNSLLVTLGRFDEAIREGERAIELDPLSLIVNADLGSTFMVARRYDEAITQLRRTLALDGNFAYARWNLGEALYFKGDLGGAIAEYEKARTLDNDPQILALLARSYAESGQKEQALKLLQKLKDVGQHQYVRSYLYTLAYIGLGEKATAIEYLEKANQDAENGDTVWIKVDPLFDPLRSEPRFQQLSARLFPEAER